MNEQNKRILELLSEGKALKEIADIIGMKERTIEKRLDNMRRKEHCRSTIQLVVKILLLRGNTKAF